MRILYVIAGFVILMVIGTVLNGWVLSILWGWFFVPILGLPELSVAQAIGIGIVVSFLTHQHLDKQHDYEEWGIMLGRAAVFIIIQPMLALLFGWVVHLFM